MAQRHSCGGTWVEATGELSVTLRGVTVQVPQREYHCSGCDEVRVRIEDAEAAEEAAATAVREELGLLHPDEIRHLRDRLGLTQDGLEQALGLGAKTVVRWETGRVMQHKATDNLLRLVARDPTALPYLGGDKVGQEHERWPNWTDLPLTLRRRLRSLCAQEEASLGSVVVMLLSEQLTLDGVTRCMDDLRVDLGAKSESNRSSVEPWLEDHKDQYERAS